jgi:flagellar biosynthesis protein FlhA
MEYREMLHRYVGRRVCISTFGHAKLWGEVAAVNDDCLRLVKTALSTDGDDPWLAQHQYGDAEHVHSMRHAETVIPLHHIVAITCLDDDLPNMADGLESAYSSAAELLPGQASAPSRRPPDPLDRLFGDEVFEYLRTERLEVLVGSELVSLADPKLENGLADRVIQLRNTIGAQLGFVLPTVRLRDDPRLADNEYRIAVNGTEVARGTVRPEKLLAINGGRVKTILDGERTLEPLFSQPAVWIEPGQRSEAEAAGYLLVEPSAVLAMHLQAEVKLHAHELFSLESLRLMLDHLRHASPTVVEELVPHRISLPKLHDLLSRLLEEEVPLRPLERILERVAHLPPGQEDTEEMLAALRLSLGRTLCERFRDASGRLPLVALDRDISARLQETLTGAVERSSSFWLAGVVDGLRSWYLDQRTASRNCPLVVDTSLRRRLRQLLAHQVPGLAVLAFAEIPHELPVQLVATLGAEELGMEVKPPRRRTRTAKKPVPATTASSSSSAPPPTKRRTPR